MRVATTTLNSTGLFSSGSICRLLGGLLLAAFMLGAGAGDAQASSSWKLMQGHSACGGIDKAGNLQEPCRFEKAKFESKARGLCPKGTFFDIGKWACYICPPGFKRNARPVTSAKACQKNVANKTSPATFHGPIKCPANAFFDPRNGGECWRCPKGFGRTAAGVDKWNACGRIGAKAQSATFVRRACPANGAFRDPRKGGECWSCPEDYRRTAAAVTAPNACKTSFDFEPATRSAALTCEPGQHFDFIDGGTCWSCPAGTKRSKFSVKSAKACRQGKMKWVVPERGAYSVFGIGRGADDILARLIAERSQIDDAVREAARVAGEPAEAMLTQAWDVIENKPWDSPYLASLLGKAVFEAAAKPAGKRTDPEKDLLKSVAKMVQWNRQFIAYQAKQAHETWLATSEKLNNEALSKAGAAVVYAGSQVAPPDYNELVTSTIQAAAGVAGPVGTALMTSFIKPMNIAFRPFGPAARKAATQAVKAFGKAALKSGAAATGTASSATMIAAAPLVIAAAIAVVVVMEFDRLVAMAKAEGKIRQAIAIADRPIDFSVMFQQKTGPDEFLFHWAAVLGGDTKPSPYFRARLAAYKAGKDPDAATAALAPPSGVATTSGTTSGTTSVATSGGLPTLLPGGAGTQTQIAAAPLPSILGSTIENAIGTQGATAPKGGMRIELSKQAGTCLTKAAGTSLAMTVTDCQKPRAMWITPNAKKKALIFADQYCLETIAQSTNGKERKHVVVAECKKTSEQKWQLTKRGFVQQVGTNKCLTLGTDSKIYLLRCGLISPKQIWRPWSGS